MAFWSVSERRSVVLLRLWRLTFIIKLSVYAVAIVYLVPRALERLYHQGLLPLAKGRENFYDISPLLQPCQG